MGKHTRAQQPGDTAQSPAAVPTMGRGAVGFEPLTPAQGAQSGGRAGRDGPGAVGASQRPRRKHRLRNALSTIFLVVGIALLATAGYLYFHAQSEYSHTRQSNEKLQKVANVQVSEDNNGAPKIDFAALEAVNDDIVGWVDVVGTSMSFPVYQGKTNNTYLRTSATGKYSVGGQVFLDCKNTKPGMVDAQSLIYGHHLNDGQMFAPLDDLKEQGNFDKVKTVWYVDRNNKAWELEPLLLYIIKSDYDDDLRTFTFASNNEFHAYLGKMLAKAVAKRSDAQQVIGGTSHVLTLVTCNYDFGHGRAVMLCVPKSEAAAATGAQAQDASTSSTTSGTTNGS